MWGLRHLAAGRAVYATGSNREAARLAGLDTSLIVFAVFVVAGALTGLAALLNAVRFNQIPTNAGLGLEMKVIAAVVVGGTAITGGRGSLAGTLLGVILLGAIGPALTFLGVSAYWERAIQGGIILTAVAIDAVRAHAAHRASGGGGELRPGVLSDRANGEAARMPSRAPMVPERRMGPAAGAGGRDRHLRRDRAELSHRRQLLRGAPVQRRAGPAGDRADAGHHHRRHRSVGRVDDGPGRGRVRRGVSRLAVCRLAAAAALALLLGAAGGSLNALLIARLGLPPLIVTLGSFSLFRGIAEGSDAGGGQLHRLPAGVPAPRTGILCGQ